jgi:hypothetical protein
MPKARPPLADVMKEMDRIGQKTIADSFRDLHILAHCIKNVRPRIKMTTAYRVAEEIQKDLGIEH